MTIRILSRHNNLKAARGSLLRTGTTLLVASLLLSAQDKQYRVEESRAPEEESRFPEVEFVASDIFRTGTYIQPLWRKLHLEGQYFATPETNVGYLGGSWVLRVKGLELAAGMGVAAGDNGFVTTPAVSLRWKYGKRWFITQGMIVHAFRKMSVGEEGEGTGSGHEASPFVRPTISDGNHVSVRWKRVTVGPTWEHIQFREGEEWKSGGRLAMRLTRHISVLFYALTPGPTEYRGGLLIHPAGE